MRISRRDIAKVLGAATVMAWTPEVFAKQNHGHGHHHGHGHGHHHGHHHHCDEQFPANTAVIDHWMLEAGTPNFIIPCVKVLRSVWELSLTDRSIVAQVTATYRSNGESISQDFELPLGEFFLSDHHPQPKNQNIRLVEVELDISDAPIDDGSMPTGSIRIARINAAA